MTKTQKITYYILLVLISALFIVSGISKLIGNAQAETSFTMAHLPLWFMYFIGVAEIAGVIGLWIRTLSSYAALGLFIVLAGACVTTYLEAGAVTALFPLVAAIVLGCVVYMGQKR